MRRAARLEQLGVVFGGQALLPGAASVVLVSAQKTVVLRKHLLRRTKRAQRQRSARCMRTCAPGR
jgi:hypothetical protein